MYANFRFLAHFVRPYARKDRLQRVDLTSSPNLGEWPLFALTGRLESTSSGHSRSRWWTSHELSGKPQCAPMKSGNAEFDATPEVVVNTPP
jgi:hypothetical protein